MTPFASPGLISFEILDAFRGVLEDQCAYVGGRSPPPIWEQWRDCLLCLYDVIEHCFSGIYIYTLYCNYKEIATLKLETGARPEGTQTYIP